MKKELIITVAGQTGTGKSTIMLLLEQFLMVSGFTVEVSLEGDVEYENNDDFHNKTAKNFLKKMEIIKSQTKITVKGQQLARDYKKDQIEADTHD